MDIIFAFLVLFGVLALVIGLIKPSIVVRWKDKATRKDVLKVYISLIFASFIGIAIFVKPLTPEQKEKIAIEKQEKITQNLEKERLQKIEEEKRKKDQEEKKKILKEKEHQQKLIDEQKEKEEKLVIEKEKIKKEQFIKTEQKRMQTEDVTISTKIDNQNGIIIIKGTTNLPNDTQLLIYVSNDLYSGSDGVKVKNGKFVSKIFTDKDKPLYNEKYEISISSKSFKEQVNDVQKIIGQNGKNLIGKLIKFDEYSKENELVYATSFKVTNSTDRKEIVSITSKNMKKVIKSLKKNYNIKATADDYDGKLNKFKMCWNDRACEVYADKVQIQATYKNVEALTSSRVSPRYYQKVCSAIMIGLTGANKELVEQQMPQYFNYASQNGRTRWEVLGVEITIRVDSDGLLGCDFYKQ